MALQSAAERGASGPPATADPPHHRRPVRPGRRLAFALLATAGSVAASVVVIGLATGDRADRAVATLGADTASAGTVGASVGATAGDAAGRPTAGGTSAIRELEDRTAADPEDLRAWQDLSRRYLQQAITTGDPAYYDLTRRALDRADALAPGDLATTVTEGVLALTLHDFAAALGLGQAAHRQVAEAPDPLAILIDASVELGRYDEAEAHLDELLSRRPGSAALSRLSYLRELHGDLEGSRLAMLQAEQATETPADRAAIATFVGDQLLAERDLTGAAAAYERARRTAPGLATTEVGRARLAAAEGHLDDAITTLAELVERVPTPVAANLLGELQQAAGRDADAADSFALARAGTELLAAAGSTVDLESAIFAADHGDPAAAVARATAAYRARRTVFTADAMGWALTKAGRATEALPYVDEALRLGTRSPGLHVHAAIARAAVGDETRSAAALRTAFESSAWLVPSLRPAAAALADDLGLAVPTDWRP